MSFLRETTRLHNLWSLPDVATPSWPVSQNQNSCLGLKGAFAERQMPCWVPSPRPPNSGLPESHARFKDLSSNQGSDPSPALKIFLQCPFSTLVLFFLSLYCITETMAVLENSSEIPRVCRRQTTPPQSKSQSPPHAGYFLSYFPWEPFELAACCRLAIGDLYPYSVCRT